VRSGVQIQNCFLPGDLVLCRALSLGDNSRGQYFLTTAEPDSDVLYERGSGGTGVLVGLFVGSGVGASFCWDAAGLVHGSGGCNKELSMLGIPCLNFCACRPLDK
jgi:hypothetical protein